MIEDLKNQNKTCSRDISRIRKEIKANQPKNFSYPKGKFGKEERIFFPRVVDLVVKYSGFKTYITNLKPLKKDNNNTTKTMFKNNCTELNLIR